MNMNEQYEAIFQEWESELKDIQFKIFRALKNAYPGGRTRRQLIFDVYGHLLPNTVDLNNNRFDRKIRLTIAKMQDDLIPIFSSSGKAGYRLDLNPESYDAMIRELARRRAEYDHKINRASKLLLKVKYTQEHALPVQIVTTEQPRQMRLGEGS
jgi:hypothetical protein